MCVSLEAIILSVFVLLSQNRQVARDRVRNDIEYEVNVKSELEIAHLHEKFDHLHASCSIGWRRWRRWRGARSPRRPRSPGRRRGSVDGGAPPPQKLPARPRPSPPPPVARVGVSVGPDRRDPAGARGTDSIENAVSSRVANTVPTRMPITEHVPLLGAVVARGAAEVATGDRQARVQGDAQEGARRVTVAGPVNGRGARDPRNEGQRAV